MSAPDADTKDVLASLPRSRRQRPTARREAARAKRTRAATPAASGTATKRASATGRATTSAAKPRPAAKATPAARKPKPTAAPKTAKRSLSPSPKRASDLPRVRPPRSAIPPAGYATPVTNRGDRGTADPGAAIGRIAGAGASVLRSVLGRLPG